MRLVPPVPNSGAAFRVVFRDRDFAGTYLGLPTQCVQLQRSSSNTPKSTPRVPNQENEWI